MLLYYITDRSQFSGGEQERRRQLLDRISRAAAAGIELVQLREKDLPARALAQLAEAALSAIRRHGGGTRLLINSRLDVALACGADGVHLTSTDAGPAQARDAARLVAGERNEESLLVAVSCHSVAEVRLAAGQGADLVVLAPIFEKIMPAHARQSGIGCDILRQACSPAAPKIAVPVLALGGVNLANAGACIEAGAAGIAGIRLFQEGNLEETVHRLRAL